MQARQKITREGFPLEIDRSCFISLVLWSSARLCIIQFALVKPDMIDMQWRWCMHTYGPVSRVSDRYICKDYLDLVVAATRRWCVKCVQNRNGSMMMMPNCQCQPFADRWILRIMDKGDVLVLIWSQKSEQSPYGLQCRQLAIAICVEWNHFK